MNTLSSDKTVLDILDKMARQFIINNRSLIDSAIRSRTNNNDLHYCIVLKNDNEVSRNVFFEFSNMYDAKMIDISRQFPIYFQFVPAHLLSKINLLEKIEV